MTVGIAKTQIQNPSPGGSGGGGGGSGQLNTPIFSIMAAGNLNLSNEGVRDWLLLSPLNGGNQLTVESSVRSKLQGDSLIRLREFISNAVPAGESTNSSPIAMSVNAGDEKCSVAGEQFTGVGASPTTNSAIWRSLFGNTTGFGYHISVIADTNLRTLNLYMGNIINAGANQVVNIAARLLDGSAPDVSQDWLNPAGTQWRKITIIYKAATGTRLEVTASMKTPSGVNAELAFQALSVF